MKIAFLPIDNRPVCYTLPKLIAQTDFDIRFLMPNREFLGGLRKNADIENLFAWLCNISDVDAIILSLDTIAYGGLIPSRRCPESFEQIKSRVEKLKEILIKKNCKIYAFSSIMRISNNNYNEEEKEYWSDWGKKIFEYSYHCDKFGTEPAVCEIPPEILEDYKQTRKRNFEINKLYLQWQKEGIFDTLIFSKDDCAEFGFNVCESKMLESLGAFTKTGADEIPLSLLSRAIPCGVKICPIFTEPEHKNLISNYEDVSIEKSVNGQIELAGCVLADEDDADILLYVNNFKENQGEIVMKIPTESFEGNFAPTNEKPFMIADVRFANGADNNFVKELCKNDLKDENFYGYSAWNTSANTLGSLICAAKVKYFSQKTKKTYDKNSFKKLQITRFLDDWGYQANVRQILTEPDEKLTAEYMKNFEKFIENIIKSEINVKYEFPWGRLFEVEIEFN